MVTAEGLFDHALKHPEKAFALGEQLAKLHPELQIVELDTGYFQLEDFAAAGKCTLEPRRDIYQHFVAHWDSEDGVVIPAKTAWFDVAWEGASLQVVMLTWQGNHCQSHHNAVMGADRARCLAFIDAVCRWSHEVRGEVLVFRDGYFTKDEKLFAAIVKADFDQLVLEGTLKQQLRDDFTQFLSSREAYEAHGVPWKRGALLIGPPGNGKTLCVKALVKHLGIPCLYVQSFDAQQHYPPQYGIETVFARARKTAPCLMVLEDIDSLLTDATRSFFLNALDGFAANTGVITLATTNHPDRLDPAIIHRPSRFDRKYHFNLPDLSTRAAYIAMWNARLQPALQLDDAGRAQLAEITDGFSFAYIQEVFVSAMMRWIATRDSAGILPVALAQIEALREQMRTAPD